MRLTIKSAAIAAALLTVFVTAQAAMAQASEDLWKALEKLSTAEREKKLIEGARKEGEMVWYTNSGIENATRYIQGFKKKYPFINANFWRSKTRQVTQRIVAEANAGKHLVDVIKPSIDLLPVLLDKNLIGRYDTPLRAIYPAHAKSPYYTNMNYAFRVFAFNPRKVNAKDAPRTWDELLNPKWKGEILFDESSLEEVMALLAAWGIEKTVNYLGKLSQQQLLIRVGRDTTTQMMMAGEAPLAVTTYGYNNESLRATNAPVDWVAQDLIPALIYPLTLARNAPHPHAAALFYDFLVSEEGQRLIAREGRVVAHPKVEPIYPRMKELQNLLGTPRIQLNTLEQNAKLLKDGVQILDEVVLKRKSSGH
ncbi:MAG TPA: extracellular solute-binding protein [Candidatus Binatia bacterium]|nr:extracellular solute-binding protein [Candidatus Binatia bacterium]